MTATSTDERMVTDRRSVLKATGAAIGLSAIGFDTIERVTATDSGFHELTLETSIPDNAGIQATVSELDPDSGDELASQTVLLDDGTNTYTLDGLDGTGEDGYDYEFFFEVGRNDDQLEPSFSAPVELVIPPEPPEYIDHETDDWSSTPDTANIVFDEDRLRTYQPRISTPDSLRHEVDVYAYVAESSDQDTYVCAYWLKLPAAEELPQVDLNSGLGAHIPLYVFVDEQTDEIDQIAYSGYHGLAAEVTPSADALSTGWADEPTHASFEVVDPWMHLRYDADGGGSRTTLEPLVDERDTWVTHDFFDAISAEAVENPWVMKESASWLAGSLDNTIVDLWRQLGLGGGKQADAVRSGDTDGILPSFDLGWWPFEYGGDN